MEIGNKMLKKLSCSATKRSCFSTNHMGAQSSREEKEGKEKKEKERTVKNGKSLARNIENEKAGGGEDENDVEDCRLGN